LLKFTDVEVLMGARSSGASLMPGKVADVSFSYSFQVEQETQLALNKRLNKLAKEKADQEALKKARLDAKNKELEDKKMAEMEHANRHLQEQHNMELESNPNPKPAMTVEPVVVEPVRMATAEADAMVIEAVQVEVLPIQGKAGPESNATVVPVATVSSRLSSNHTKLNGSSPAESKMNRPMTATEIKVAFGGSITTDQASTLENFTSIVNYFEINKAKRLLEICNWNISRAMERYYQAESVDSILKAHKLHNV